MNNVVKYLEGILISERKLSNLYYFYVYTSIQTSTIIFTRLLSEINSSFKTYFRLPVFSVNGSSIW